MKTAVVTSFFFLRDVGCVALAVLLIGLAAIGALNVYDYITHHRPLW